MPHVPKPEIIASLDAQTSELLGKASDAYRWLYGTAHATPVRADGGGGRGGHSDPTAGAVLDPWLAKCRQEMVMAYREAKKAQAAALAAYRACARALDAEPEHPYAVEVKDYTTKADMKGIVHAKNARAKRDDGWGEA